jgi:hypothetical protein
MFKLATRRSTTTKVRHLTYTRMVEVVRAGRSGFVGCSFADALQKPLGFRISINDAATVQQFPEIFALGKSEYGYNLDAFLNLVDATNNSASAVAARDVYLSIIKLLLPRSIVEQRQPRSSSKNNRYGFAVSVSGVLGMLGVHDDQVPVSFDERGARLLLSRTIYASKFRSALPKGQHSVPGIASTVESLVIYNVSLDDSDGSVVCTAIKKYSINELSGRVQFTVDLVKLITWFSANGMPQKACMLNLGICGTYCVLCSKFTSSHMYTARLL